MITVDALMGWAQLTLSKLNVRTIAVAGSTTKSITVDAITHILATRHQVHRGNLDVTGPLNVALSLAKLTPNHDYAVLKLNPTQPGEMAQLVTAIRPSIAVLNNIDCVFPAAFENCQQVIDEQAILMEYLSPGGLAVINYDDDATRDLGRHVHDGVLVKTIGIDRFGADALAFNVKVGVERTGFDLRFAGERYIARWSPIPGKHHLYGLLAALVVGTHCDVTVEDASKVLSNLEPLPGRMRLLDGQSDILLVDDTYAATHGSAMAALDWLAEVKADHHRSIFVIGDPGRFGHQQPLCPSLHRAAGRRSRRYYRHAGRGSGSGRAGRRG